MKAAKTAMDRTCLSYLVVQVVSFMVLTEKHVRIGMVLAEKHVRVGISMNEHQRSQTKAQ